MRTSRPFRRSLWRSGIFRHLLVGSLLLSLLPLILFSQRAIERSRRILEDEAPKRLKIRSMEIAARVTDLLRQCESDLHALALLPPTPEAFQAFSEVRRRPIWTREGTNRRPREVVREIPLYAELALIDAGGEERILIRGDEVQPESALRDVSRPENTTYRSEDYFARTRDVPAGEIYVSHLTGFHVSKPEQLGDAGRVEDAVEGKRFRGVIRFGMPIYENEEFSGVLLLSLDHRHLQEMVEHVDPLSGEPVITGQYSRGDYAFMFDDEGWVICHPKHWDIRGLDPEGQLLPPYRRDAPEELVRRGHNPVNVFELGWVSPEYIRVIEDLQAGRAGTAQMRNLGYTGVQAKVRTWGYAPIPYDTGDYAKHGIFGGVAMGAAVVTAAPIAQTLARELYIVLGLVCILVAATAVILSRTFSRPIVALTGAASRVGAGDLSQRIPVTSDDEFGDLARTFNQMCRDILEKEEELRRAERFASIGEVISGTAHAFKTQLNLYGLINNVSLLSRLTGHDDPRRKYVDQIREGLEGMERAVVNLLSPVPEPDLERVEVAELLAAAARPLAERGAAQNVVVRTRCDDGLPPVKVDRQLITQVLKDLAANSLDAMPKGGTLTLRASAVDAKVFLEVEDTGVGIPPEDRQKVLFPFFTTKRDQGGTGLGLYSSYRIVRSHGGQMDLSSEVGKGTIVRIELPAAVEG